VTRGFLLGKFYPPHQGHHELIEAARAQCDELIVLVMAASAETISMADRHRWLAERHPDVVVRSIVDDVPVDYDDPEIWDAHVALARAAVPERIDVVFTGEAYGVELAERLGARSVIIEREGRSASAVRADVAGHWDELSGPVRAGLAKRVVVLGAESTGTTTLSTALAARFGAAWVPEYGRAYSVDKQAAGTLDVWTPEDFIVIAARQSQMEDATAATGGPVLVCDTDALATVVFEELYLGAANPVTEHLARGRVPDLYVLTSDAGIAWEDDGLREFPDSRAWMTARFRERLAEQPAPWIEVVGSRGERLATAAAAVDGLLRDGWRFGADPTSLVVPATEDVGSAVGRVTFRARGR
jgi:NadR type nicotinamide-nucleotide adenylyltransferase